MKNTLKLVPLKSFLNLLVAMGTMSVAFGQGEMATGTVSGVLNGGSYDYTIILDNTSGSVSIGSLWYGWIPFSFFLPGTPDSASAPTGWSASVVANSIEFTGNPGVFLAPGQSIQFNYVASFAPSDLTGNTGLSYVYTGGIEGDPGALVDVAAVPAPEPSSLSLLTAGFLGLAFAGRRKLRKLATAA